MSKRFTTVGRKHALVRQGGFAEGWKVLWPDVRASHDAVVRPFLVMLLGSQLFPTKFEPFVHVTHARRVIVATQKRIVALESGRLGDVQFRFLLIGEREKLFGRGQRIVYRGVWYAMILD